MNYLLEAITPTRIYHKQCSHCGKNYMGKTISKNIEAYKGSGVDWTKHLKEHNAKSIHIWNSDWFYDTSIVEYALGLSKQYNIVESDDWFNAKAENGLDGGPLDPLSIIKMKSTNLQKYGFENVFEVEAVKDKIDQTNLEKYGVKRPLQSPVFREKTKETCLEKYGVENPLQSSLFREKGKETCLGKYGVENPQESSLVRGKIKDTCLEKYGGPSPASSPEVVDRMLISRKILSTRPQIEVIKSYVNVYKVKLNKGWYQKSDEWLNETIGFLVEEYGVL